MVGPPDQIAQPPVCPALRVEHVFGVVKRLWGFNKVRYRGLAKNATRAFTALALANIFMSRKRLMA